MQNMQKQMKNVQSLHNWQFQSLKFHKMAKLVPGYSKNIKKSSKVLFNHKVTYLVLWCKVSQNYKFSPCTLEIDRNGPWDVKNFEKRNFGPYTNNLLQEWSLVLSLVNLHDWSLKFGELANIVPGYFKSENYQNLPLYYSYMAN